MYDEGHTEAVQRECLHVSPDACLKSVDYLPGLGSSDIPSDLETLKLQLRICCHVEIRVREGHKADDSPLGLGHQYEAEVAISQDLDHCNQVL